VLIAVSCTAVGAAVVAKIVIPPPAPVQNDDPRMSLPGVLKPDPPYEFADWMLLAVLVLVGVAWMVWLLVYVVVLARRESKAKAERRGQVVCTYCSEVICEDVKLLGQTVTCPKCHATVKAPGGLPDIPFLFFFWWR
jgi:hypothetical protein